MTLPFSVKRSTQDAGSPHLMDRAWKTSILARKRNNNHTFDQTVEKKRIMETRTYLSSSSHPVSWLQAPRPLLCFYAAAQKHLPVIDTLRAGQTYEKIIDGGISEKLKKDRPPWQRGDMLMRRIRSPAILVGAIWFNSLRLHKHSYGLHLVHVRGAG